MTLTESREEKYQKALDLMKRELFEEAAALVSQLAEMDDLSQGFLMDILVLTGNAYLQVSEYEKARRYLEQVKEQAGSYKAALAEALLGLGDLAWKVNRDLETAGTYYAEASEILKELSLPLFELYKHYADYYAGHGNFNLALEYQEKTLEFARESGDSVELCKGLIDLGTVKANREEFYEAIELFEEAERESQKSDLAKELNLNLIALKNTAAVYFYKGEIRTAAEIFEEAMNLKEISIVRIPVNLELLTDLVIFHTDMLDLEDADRYLNELKYFSEKSNNALVQLTTELTMAYYLKMFTPESASAQLKKVLDVAKVLNDDWIASVVQISIAELSLFDYRNRQDENFLKEASRMFYETYKIAQRGSLIPLVISSLIVMSYLSLIENDQEKAKKQALQASLLASENGLIGHEKRAKQIHDFIFESSEKLNSEYAGNLREFKNARTFEAIKSLKKASRFFSIFRKAFY
ncbi:MAG: tetratricopeptide repeat protein [Candidatus Hodarchaeales archaeon]|jgi:tetratricopeptide (TPR) repeat protein